MANSYFQFKQFRIEQDRCAMKMGTDAVILGALAHLGNAKIILDIGTGTGVIALMLAQRFPDARVHGVEIEAQAFSQAAQNFRKSPWNDRMEIFHAAFQDYSKSHSKKYDLIVSNPPYFSNQLKSSNARKNWARHDDQLSLKDLLGVWQLLSEEGLFWLILPLREMRLFRDLAGQSGFSLQHEYLIRDRSGVNPHREICSFGKRDQYPKTSGEIILKQASGQADSSYRELLKNFLLHF
ncbi:tRNA1(Val) (adenine(37)-N6)-methyltransferase [Cyclobacterium plantarum]|uniref:tRNA1(Val) (adenine(37)-N6)-methyltransferase n=1 Tax=Cyclobacterium plantarum TaxID=2716263 RepID=A0ABX0HBC6_9BACT|nr:methyltransferase [Cyclobacterium plantarum]NHE59205.1 methyltransferase [Cyclobacterium plantarum]